MTTDKRTINIQKWEGASAIDCARDLTRKPYTIFLDSNCPNHPLSQWSFICFDPIETIEVKNGIITHNSKNLGELDLFDFLQSRLDNYDFKNIETDIPFIGGAAGYFSYDLGRQLETIPNNTIDDINMPDACVGIYTNVLAFDHKANEAWLIGDDMPELGAIPASPYIAQNIDWTTNKDDESYCQDIKKTIDYIYAGEIYQANISRRFEAKLPNSFNAFNHYEYLRRINPAPFSAFINFENLQLSSCSPEQFLHVKNNTVTTRPIKGTLSSSQDPQTLLASKKDIAENTMIVDLLRNDLSKVCDYHSVKVPELCKLETFEGLHHLVSTVKGILQKNKTPLDVLRACFPGGSITGAPKISAIKIIEEIEQTSRGAYCGAIGYIGFNGTMDTNVTIRTLIYANDKAYLQTGSGIVSDSTPEKELQESLDKASKIFESFKNKNKETAA